MAASATTTALPLVGSTTVVSVPKQDVIVPLPAKLVAGGVAGVIGTSIIFPIDMVKTRLQNQSASAPGGLRYTGPIDCFKKIVAAEGTAGLYRGLKPNLIGVTPEKALKLSVNDLLRERFIESNKDGRIRLWQEILSGGSAGLIQVAATNPMEIVKLRMQLQGESGGVQKSAMQTINELGLRGLYRGMFACWLRDVPFSFIFFPLFANLKTLLRGDESIVGLFTAGAIAGSVSAGVVTPCDVVKTRLQVVGGSERYPGGIRDAFVKIYQQEGAGAFAKGLLPRMMVQAPLFGITLLSYEVLKAFYRRRQLQHA